MDYNFEPPRSMAPWVQWPQADQSPKIHYGALSIRNFVLKKAQLITSHAYHLTNNQKMCYLFLLNYTTKVLLPKFIKIPKIFRSQIEFLVDFHVKYY
jgi:hypothetical protein